MEDAAGARAVTLPLRVEVDPQVELGRLAWVLTMAAQESYALVSIVVRTEPGGRRRRMDSNYLRAHLRVGDDPSMSEAALLVWRPGAGGSAEEFQFCGRRYSDSAALQRDLRAAQEYSVEHHGRNLALGIVTDARLSIGEFVAFADQIAAIGLTELDFAPLCIPSKAELEAKRLPESPPRLIGCAPGLGQVFERNQAIAEQKDPHLAVARALSEFPADEPETLRGWKPTG